MREDNFKNTIVLKNIPSNIVDEAIIVLKENKKAWKMQKVENGKNSEEMFKPIKKDYIVKEAECVVANYLEKISSEENTNDNRSLKYNRLKRYAFFSTGLLIVQFIINIFI